MPGCSCQQRGNSQMRENAKISHFATYPRDPGSSTVNLAQTIACCQAKCQWVCRQVCALPTLAASKQPMLERLRVCFGHALYMHAGGNVSLSPSVVSLALRGRSNFCVGNVGKHRKASESIGKRRKRRKGGVKIARF